MNKVLTISIAAYNVQEYIKHTLDSLIVPEVMDDLEVFIVDDGGSDSTLEIAKKYEDEYPNTFKAVHKENGGYGSTVNWSISHAHGKYFKLLDGDDWFSRDGLIELITQMKSSNKDAFISNVNEVIEGVSSKEKYDFCKKYDGEVLSSKNVAKLPTIAMWALSFKTEILKGKIFELPQHSMYTDLLFVVFGLANSSLYQIIGTPVYNWRLGRDEQSNNIKVFEKHKKELSDVLKNVIAFYQQKKLLIEDEKRKNVMHRIIGDYVYYVGMLQKLPHTKKNLDEIKAFDQYLKANENDVYKKSFRSKRMMALRVSGYLIYWVM